MKKLLTFTFIAILSTSLMVACGNEDSTDEGNNEEQTNESNELISNNEQEEVANENTNEEIEENETNENNEENTSNGNNTSGNYEDQTDLRLGDSGKMETTIGEYEVTFSNTELFTEIGGTESPLDYLVTVDISVTNLGESDIEADDIRRNFEIGGSKDGGGFSDVSGSVDSVEAFEGTISPSETLDGQMVVAVEDIEEYYIFVKAGLTASGAVSNNLIWTFDKSEAE